MSIVHYNGIVLPHSQAASFKKGALQDEFSKTDWYLTKYEIVVQCLINTNYINLIDPTLTSNANPLFKTSPANICQAIYTKLMTKRKTLAYIVDGVDMIPSLQNGNTGTVDAKNGPEPKSCNFINLTDSTFILVFSIVAHYWENNQITPSGTPLVSLNKKGNIALSNKWMESVEIDQFGLTTRNRNGEFVIRSDNYDGATPYDLIPQMTMLTIPSGFMRQKSRYTMTPDGLKLKYDIIDKEWYKTPPPPAYYAEGTYSETTSKADALRYGHCTVALRGGKSSNPGYTQTDLLLVCIAIVGAKIRLAGESPLIFGQNGYILMSAEIKVNMYQNEVVCSMSVMLPRTRYQLVTIQGPNVGGIQFESTNRRLCQTPLYDESPKTVSPMPLKGNANLIIQAAAYYDPNLVGVKLDPQTGQLTQGDKPGTTGV